MVSWPVLFVYPSSMQTDAVEAFHELHTFSDHLDVMFGPEVRACALVFLDPIPGE